MPSLTAAILTEFSDDAYRADLASVVGPRSVEGLTAWIDERCREQLSSRVASARFACKSVGAVFGLVLADGRAVVLKLFPATFDAAALHAIARCHAHVVAAGFPAPRPLVPLFRSDGVWGTFYDLVDGEFLDAHRPDVRRALAEALAELARVTSTLASADLPKAPTRAATRWGTPHRLGMDLEWPGGEWIDARADIARRTIADLEQPLCAAHLDWGVKNALFHAGRLRAMLDWDSMMQASEAEMVGRAAAQFTAQWETLARLTPTPAEATAFVREYEHARGRSFVPAEQRIVNASADYLMAQVARQEHGELVRADGYQALLRATETVPLVAF